VQIERLSKWRKMVNDSGKTIRPSYLAFFQVSDFVFDDQHSLLHRIVVGSRRSHVLAVLFGPGSRSGALLVESEKNQTVVQDTILRGETRTCKNDGCPGIILTMSTDSSLASTRSEIDRDPVGFTGWTADDTVRAARRSAVRDGQK